MFAECPGKKLEGFAQPSKSVFIEAALVSLFISRRQYSSLIPKNVLGDRIVLCPDEVTNAKLPTIFRQPDKPIFGEILTFTLGPEGARVRPDPWYNLMFCNYDKEVKVVGLWGDNPVLFEFQEKEVKFNGISLRKLEKLENGFQVCWKQY